MRKRTRQRKSWPAALPSKPPWNSVDVSDADAILDSLNHQISQLEFISACREVNTRDGYGGLVRICDDQMFRERGLISESVRPSQPSPASSSIANTGSGASEMDAMSDVGFPVVSGSGDYGPGLEDGNSYRIAKFASLSYQGSSPLQKSLSSEPPAPKHKMRCATLEIPPSPRILIDDSTMGQSEEKQPSGVHPMSSQRGADDNQDATNSDDVEKWRLQLKLLLSGKYPPDQKRIRAAFIADQAFRSAATHLQGGDYEQAVQLAEIAAGACPADKLVARDKINRLKQVAVKRLQLSSPTEV